MNKIYVNIVNDDMIKDFGSVEEVVKNNKKALAEGYVFACICESEKF